MAQLENIEAIEKRLWGSADTLRWNWCRKSQSTKTREATTEKSVFLSLLDNINSAFIPATTKVQP
ncbi:MAG: hypothetical protein COA74_09100 [Gammaproteobacteria bacterium]|nr:MAG: hypothetical protein COA74_09100 [Gammaproteobacteria bacterium]